MKLASYHSQIGDSVTFITEEFHLTGNHDVLYLVRELRHTPFPPGDLIDDYRTVLMGKEFQMFEGVADLPIEAAVCRPDYSIYHFKENNIYTRASFVQFFQGNIYLKNVQDWHRADERCVIVVDQNLWDAPPQTIIECLNILASELNVIFIHPIKLLRLQNEEIYNAFIQLKLAKFYKLRYNNSGEDYESLKQLIDIMDKLRRRYSYLNIGSIPVKIITKDHWVSKDNIMYDFKRCLQIMTYSQTKMVRINFKYPTMRLASPSWPYFEFFKTWSNHYHTYSYIPALLKGATEYYKKPYYEVINNEKLWNTFKIKQTIYLLGKFTDLMKEYGFIQYGGGVSPIINLIDFDYVKEKGIENSIL